MPRENRKRGKKHKKQPEQAEQEQVAEVQPPVEEFSRPSWIKPAHTEEEDAAAPFGYVEADVKAYFRTVDVQIRGWAETAVEQEEDAEDHDPNEEKRMFFIAALQEMSGKEKQLATDPDCSTILERMSYSMDDFVRRIFVDSLSGSYEQLVKHRFASHVCQTLFTVAADTVSRECRGNAASPPDEEGSGDLRKMSQLVLDVSEELIPSFTSLIMDPFASHVLRALLILLCPGLIASSQSPSNLHSAMRSKKSAAWKARQGPMKSVFTADKSSNITPEAGRERSAQVPETFSECAGKVLQAVRKELGPNEVRALAADKVASPLLQLLLELEAEKGWGDEPDSLMDRVLVGLITCVHNAPDQVPTASDYLGTLLRDPTSSHLLETLVARSPPAVFALLYRTYFAGKLGRLAAHPVANFVVARAVRRADEKVLLEAVEELDGALGKVVKASRTGVVRALIDRAASLKRCEADVVTATCAAFELDSSSAEDRALVVPCILRLKTRSEYTAAISSANAITAEGGVVDASKRTKSHKVGHKPEDPLAPTTQGSVLLQALLHMSNPHNQVVIDSIQAMSVDELIALSHDPTSSRVLDELIDSPMVPKQAKRKLILAFIGHLHRLVDDRIGSRVGDRIWAASDPYLKEKIGRSLFPYEQNLAASYYGKFFARNLNLHLLRRNADEWKNRLSRPAADMFAATPSIPAHTGHDVVGENKVKAKRKAVDEIDVLFDDAGLSKRKKRGALAGDGVGAISLSGTKPNRGRAEGEDRGLEDVLGAIQSAPKGELAKKGRRV